MNRISRLSRIDQQILRLEKVMIGGLFLAMSGAVFVDVVHRVFSRSPGRLSFILSSLLARLGVDTEPEALDRLVSPIIMLLAGWLLSAGAISTSKKENGITRRSWLQGLGAVAIATLLIQGTIRLMPHGFVWSPYFGLIGFLWVGLLGASAATALHQHLQLEMGEKLWPKRFLPTVLKVNRLASSLFCLGLAVLAFFSVRDHYQDWAMAGGSAALIPSLGWPKWIVYLVIPYSFTMMSLRFLLGPAAPKAGVEGEGAR